MKKNIVIKKLIKIIVIGQSPKFSLEKFISQLFLPLEVITISKQPKKTNGINKDQEIYQLLSKESIRKHRSSGYNFIHIGLVQIIVKPTFIKGIHALEMLDF